MMQYVCTMTVATSSCLCSCSSVLLALRIAVTDCLLPAPPAPAPPAALGAGALEPDRDMESCLRMPAEEAGDGASPGAPLAECAAELIFLTAIALNLKMQRNERIMIAFTSDVNLQHAAEISLSNRLHIT